MVCWWYECRHFGFSLPLSFSFSIWVICDFLSWYAEISKVFRMFLYRNTRRTSSFFSCGKCILCGELSFLILKVEFYCGFSIFLHKMKAIPKEFVVDFDISRGTNGNCVICTTDDTWLTLFSSSAPLKMHWPKIAYLLHLSFIPTAGLFEFLWLCVIYRLLVFMILCRTQALSVCRRLTHTNSHIPCIWHTGPLAEMEMVCLKWNMHPRRCIWCNATSGVWLTLLTCKFINDVLIEPSGSLKSR